MNQKTMRLIECDNGIYSSLWFKKKKKIESAKKVDEKIVQKNLHNGPIRECKPLSIRLTNLTSSATVTTMFKHSAANTNEVKLCRRAANRTNAIRISNSSTLFC